MAAQFGLFLGNSARNRDVAEAIAVPGERQDIGTLVEPSVPAIERLNTPVGQNSDRKCAPSGAGCDAGEPPAQSFRAGVSATLFDHAHLDTQTCPPFPVNDS